MRNNGACYKETGDFWMLASCIDGVKTISQKSCTFAANPIRP